MTIDTLVEQETSMLQTAEGRYKHALIPSNAATQTVYSNLAQPLQTLNEKLIKGQTYNLTSIRDTPASITRTGNNYKLAFENAGEQYVFDLINTGQNTYAIVPDKQTKRKMTPVKANELVRDISDYVHATSKTEYVDDIFTPDMVENAKRFANEINIGPIEKINQMRETYRNFSHELIHWADTIIREKRTARSASFGAYTLFGRTDSHDNQIWIAYSPTLGSAVFVTTDKEELLNTTRKQAHESKGVDRIIKREEKTTEYDWRQKVREYMRMVNGE